MNKKTAPFEFEVMVTFCFITNILLFLKVWRPKLTDNS